MLKGADLYDPAGGTGPATPTGPRTPSVPQARWSWILDREVENKLMSKSERAKYTVKNFPMPRDQEPVASKKGQIGYLMDTAKKYVLKHAPDISERAVRQEAATRSGRPSTSAGPSS